MSDLTPRVARHVIDTVGGNGTPPQYGFQFFTAGIDPYVSVLDREYMGSFIREGGSAFKMVVGVYGGGKTHFLYCMRDLAWKHGFSVSYVSLSPGECPFHKLELVYAAIVRNLVPPLPADELVAGYGQGIGPFIRRWFMTQLNEAKSQVPGENDAGAELLARVDRVNGIESISFTRAVKSAFRALLENREDDFVNICQWLSGEGYDRRVHSRYGILQRIDRSTAFPMIRSLVQWIRQCGYAGLIVLLDEAERVPSLSSKQREQLLGNLRELIDECGHTNFQGVMIFYAVPDENFLEGRAQVYEALKQRVATFFDDRINPTGVKIELEKMVGEPLPFLHEVGEKLAKVYSVAYPEALNERERKATIELAASTAYEERYGDIGYRRLFVQRLIKGLHVLRNTGKAPTKNDLT